MIQSPRKLEIHANSSVEPYAAEKVKENKMLPGCYGPNSIDYDITVYVILYSNN